VGQRIVSEQTPLQPSERERLEIQKLHTDIEIANFNKWAQLITPVSVLVSAAAVLLLFQQPQISQMEATRVSNERIQIGNELIAIEQLTNPQDKTLMLDTLKRIWPNHEEIQIIEDANRTVSQPLPQPGNTPQTRCAPYASRYADLRANLMSLKDKFNAEQPAGRTMGLGPISRAIQDQIHVVDIQIEKLKEEANSVNCTL
jgi:hypothetical protein